MTLLMEATCWEEQALLDESSRLHAAAWRTRKLAADQARAAADFDVEHNIMPPCHRCGRRNCGH